MRPLKGHTSYVECLAFSPDGRLLASGAADHALRLWDVATGACREAVDVDGSEVGAVGFSPDGRLLAAGTYEGTVVQHAVEATLRPSLRWQGQGRVCSTTYSADGAWFGWCSYRGVVICDRRRGYLNTTANTTFNQFCLRFTPDGALFARGGESSLVLLCDPATQAVRRRLKHSDDRGCWCVALSADGRALVMALAGGIQVWDVTTRRMTQRVSEHTETVSCVALSADGTRLITGSWDSEVRVHTFDSIGCKLGPRVGGYNWGLGRLYDVALSPDGTLAAVAGQEGIVLWDVE